MLLRSSSTPILGSLLSSSSSAAFFSESPNTHHPHLNPTFHPFSCHLSPISDSSDRTPSSLGIRRARSDGNLESLLPEIHGDSHHHPHRPSLKCSASRRPNPVLETIPSFCVHNGKGSEGEEEEEEQQQQGLGDLESDVVPPMSAAIGNSISGESNVSGWDQNPSLVGRAPEYGASPLFLARGLGIDRLASGLMSVGGGSGSGSGNSAGLPGSGGEQSDMEVHYKRMVEENPTNALCLSNYAQFLYQTKGDPRRAEEYYSRAILADPSDGEILAQYAKLVWELHRDDERANSYFERAVQAAPEDSHVLGAYAGFLWQTVDDDDDDDDGRGKSDDFAGRSVRHGALTSATA